MQNVISTAANQYANRPKDETYPDLPSMIQAAEYERACSKELGYALRDLQAMPVESGLMMQSPRGTQATISHYAFGQLSRMIGAPASYLRTIDPQIAAAAVNYSIQHHAEIGARATLLVKANGAPNPHIRSITSTTYGRLWDAALYGSAQKYLFDRPATDGQPWIIPPVWGGGTAGTWRGDRTSFIIRVDGGSIVNDPSVRGEDGRMFRGIMIRNSEVGASAAVIERVLFQYICGNLNLWGAMMDKSYRRRHVGSHVLSDVTNELVQTARAWSHRSASLDEAIIKGLIDHELAQTREGVLDALQKMKYTKEQAETAISTCEEHFNASPRSYWGITQGTTKMSQLMDYQDDRYELDKLAASVLAKGRVLVAA